MSNLSYKKPIAIIGAGSIIKDAHLPAYQKADFEVLAIYDLNNDKAQSIADEFGIPNVFNDLEGLISLAIKESCVFDIAIPANHILSVLHKIPVGSSVLIQKPMGESLQEAEEILKCCNERNLVAGVNFQLRHAPYIQKVKQMIESGDIGELHDVGVRLNVNTPWHLWDFLKTKDRVEILYHSIHYIDMVRYFLGEPSRIMAKTTIDPRMKDMSATRSSIIMDYGAVVRANINTNHGMKWGIRNQESYFKFEGTKGAVKITVGVYLDYPKGKPDKFEYIIEGMEDWEEKTITGSWFPDAFVGPMEGLMKKTLDSNFNYINDINDAVKTMKWVEMCYTVSGNNKVYF